MGWKDERANIKKLMKDLEATDDGSGEETDAYLKANRKLDDAIKALPAHKRFNFLYS